MTIGDPPTGSGANRRRYLVGSLDATLLSQVAEDLKADPGVVVDRILQTSTGAGGIVVEATEATAADLRARYPGLVVEPDQQLGQFSVGYSPIANTYPSTTDLQQSIMDLQQSAVDAYPFPAAVTAPYPSTGLTTLGAATTYSTVDTRTETDMAARDGGTGRKATKAAAPKSTAKSTRAAAAKPRRPRAEGRVTPASTGPGEPSSRSRSANAVAPRRERYLVAPLPASLLKPQSAGVIGNLMGFSASPPPQPLHPAQFLAQLDADPTVTVSKVLKRSTPPAPTGPAVGMLAAAPYGLLGNLQAFGVNPAAPAAPSLVDFPEVAVVEMDPDRASAFAAEPTVHVEPDLPLRYGAALPVGLTVADPGLVPFGAEADVTIAVKGPEGEPIVGAEVYLMSSTFPARGVTGNDGKAVLQTSANAIGDIAALYVKPAGDYWTLWLANPEISTTRVNTVTCRPLSETFPDFPDKQLRGWGWKAMRFDALPPTFRGHGVKVAIIDSGAATTHPDLAGQIAAGRDIEAGNDTGWKVDTVGHGSHCAGIIGGKDNGTGILGIVPEAEIHSCKIFPSGRFSDLIEALDYCIANQIDVVNLSLGTPEPGELVRLKIEQARQAGVACVVAAGNSANAVCFPANMPTVLAVSAIGKLGEYPPDTYHATQTSGTPTPEGYFSAKFTCFGPEIDVCGPGVAIVSSVPPDMYAAEDGTSFAGPHITALAALILAHHPDFRMPPFAQRGPARVDRLFSIIKASSRPIDVGDPNRTGAGLPDAAVALGIAAGPWGQPGAGVPGGPGYPGGVGFPGGIGYPGGVGLPGGIGYPGGPGFPGGIGYPGGPGLPGGFGYPGGPGYSGGPGFPGGQGGPFPYGSGVPIPGYGVPGMSPIPGVPAGAPGSASWSGGAMPFAAMPASSGGPAAGSHPDMRLDGSPGAFIPPGGFGTPGGTGYGAPGAPGGDGGQAGPGQPSGAATTGAVGAGAVAEGQPGDAGVQTFGAGPFGAMAGPFGATGGPVPGTTPVPEPSRTGQREPQDPMEPLRTALRAAGLLPADTAARHNGRSHR
jgi:subtilisin